jgi:hypothetical protein
MIFLQIIAELVISIALIMWMCSDPQFTGVKVNSLKVALLTFVMGWWGVPALSSRIVSVIGWFIRRVTAEPEKLSITVDNQGGE